MTSRRRECLLVLGGVLGVLLLRHLVLPHPFRPHYRWWSWQTHPFLNLAAPFYGYLCGRIFWLPLTALAAFFGAGALIRAQRKPWARDYRTGLTLAAALTGVLLLDVLLNGARLTDELSDKLWFFVEPQEAGYHAFALATMLGTLYAYYLIVKYRRRARTVTAFGLMALAYLPVVGLDGYHYWLGGGVLRAVFWPLVLQAAWRDALPLWRRGASPPVMED